MLFNPAKHTPPAPEIGLQADQSLSQAGWFSREQAVMGTSVRVELWSPDRQTAEMAIGAVMDEMHRIDRLMSLHKPDSELSRINRHAGRQAVQVSEEMVRLIARSMQFSEVSGGAFDITCAGIGQLFDYRLGIRPSDETLEKACATVGYRHLLLDIKARTVRFGRDGMRVDLGGFAKGHAVNNSVAILERFGIAHATVSAGADSHVMGQRGGRPWTIGIRDPRRAGQVLAVLPVQDVAISTSSDYQRFFEEDGVRYHNVIDPRTGQSPSAVRSVTIFASDGLTSEALSKSVFVMGVERGLRFIESRPGVDAVLVDAAGGVHYSSGLSSGLLSAGSQTRQ